MSALVRMSLLALFGTGATWQLAVAAMPPSPPRMPDAAVRMPGPPAGWSLVSDEKIWPDPNAAGRKTLYRAPSGAEIALERRLAWPQRRDIPLSFFPMECRYLNEGWDFQERSGGQEIGAGLVARRIRVSQGKQRLLELSGFACEGRLVPEWQEFKWHLVGQRLRRQRELWQMIRIDAPQNPAATREAGELFLATLREPPLRSAESRPGGQVKPGTEHEGIH